MKQHITIKQLNELSKEEKKLFRIFFDKIYDGDLLVFGSYDGKLENKISVFKYGMISADEDCFGYKLCSIGSMIEFLDSLDERRQWIDYLGGDVDKEDEIYPSGENLCDVLWEEVKKKLVTLAKRPKASVS